MTFWVVVLSVLFTVGLLQHRRDNHREGILATAKGRSKSEMLGLLGHPKSISTMAGGKTLLQWQKKGSHISMMFKGEICEGLTHRYGANGLRA